MGEIKQVIAVRTDLRMGRGKLAVQVAHASLMGAEEANKRAGVWHQQWKRSGQAKIAVRIESLEGLLALKDKAHGLSLPVAIVQDRGLTQVSEGTVTCLAIGPGPSLLMDTVTGHLKLL